jgi:hypothetical protein
VLLLNYESRVKEYTREDYKFAQFGVWAKLREFNCPKQGNNLRSDRAVEEKMARRVAKALKLSL